ncbi:hypothetical protein ABC977_13970 [Thioalkalicoccus limnaeus]|uniref:Uncharacterized protein n=1 Tax=Thioalkalicoccus limnaeus TaxID=120681 RepID=A0ABV4BI89_9GAMM
MIDTLKLVASAMGAISRTLLLEVANRSLSIIGKVRDRFST